MMRRTIKSLGPYGCLFLQLAVAITVQAPVTSASYTANSSLVSLPLSKSDQNGTQLVPPKPPKSWYGIAGWYGEEFDGRLTANGEVFDMYAATAAHLTLPLGSVLRISYPKTGRSVIIRINDRGPYVKGRELDVSYEVARFLGFDKKGLARVRIELVEVPNRHWQQKPTDDD